MSNSTASKGTLPEQNVRAMFDRIAGRYDCMNSVMTAGLQASWRERAADAANAGPGMHMLDVATGTGELAFALARRVAPGGSVVGADFATEMLAIARKKQAERLAGVDTEVGFEEVNALNLPYDDNMFDAATVGFGARNFSDLAVGLREMARVVRPGGKIVILELSLPHKPPLSCFFGMWFNALVPLVGRLGGENSAYSYLPNSVKRFAGPRELAGLLQSSGTHDVRWIALAGGIVTIHHAVVN